MNIRDAYNTWSGTYDSDRNLTRNLDERVTREALAGSRYASILEIGCGTGKNTVVLAQIGDHVRAIDFSEGMIGQARAKVVAPNVTFTAADLTRPWPCDGASVDLVVCNLVLEHIADLAHVFAEAYRCLAEGGRFFVCELHSFKQYLGARAGYRQDLEIPAFVHNISSFVDAATAAGFTLSKLGEWWDGDDHEAPPRLVSFMFRK